MNWKILVEQFLEGYHIRSTHKDTFYPIQYDDLNVVERFGPNSRITFPYKNIERLRDRPESTWTVERRVTYVYHLFPNVMVATFPDQVLVVVVDPVDVDHCTVHIHAMVTPERAEELAKAVGAGAGRADGPCWRPAESRTTRCRKACNVACAPVPTPSWSSAGTRARSATSTPPSTTAWRRRDERLRAPHVRRDGRRWNIGLVNEVVPSGTRPQRAERPACRLFGRNRRGVKLFGGRHWPVAVGNHAVISRYLQSATIDRDIGIC